MLSKHVMQGPFKHPAGQKAVVEKEVEEWPLVDLFLALDDESQAGKGAEVHLDPGRLAELVAEIGDQGLPADWSGNAPARFERSLAGKHLLLPLAVLHLLPLDLALPFGEDNQGPKHHEEGDGAAVQVHGVGHPRLLFSEDRLFHIALDPKRHVPRIRIVYEFQTAGVKTAVEILSKRIVDQGLCGKPILSRQMLTGEQF